MKLNLLQNKGAPAVILCASIALLVPFSLQEITLLMLLNTATAVWHLGWWLAAAMAIRNPRATRSQYLVVLWAVVAVALGWLPLLNALPGVAGKVLAALEIFLLCQGWWLLILRSRHVSATGKKAALAGSGLLVFTAVLNVAMSRVPLEEGGLFFLLMVSLFSVICGIISLCCSYVEVEPT